MMSAADSWGPWSPDITPAERLARLRSMRTVAQLMCGKNCALAKALFLAESQTDEDLGAALLVLDGMPALDRRKVLSSYAAVTAYKPPPMPKEGAA